MEDIGGVTPETTVLVPNFDAALHNGSQLFRRVLLRQQRALPIVSTNYTVKKRLAIFPQGCLFILTIRTFFYRVLCPPLSTKAKPTLNQLNISWLSPQSLKRWPVQLYRPREYWIRLLPPAYACKLVRRNTGRLMKRDNLLTGEGGGQEPNHTTARKPGPL